MTKDEFDFVVICDDQILKYYDEKEYAYVGRLENMIRTLIPKFRRSEKYKFELNKKIIFGLINQKKNIYYWCEYWQSPIDVPPITLETNDKPITFHSIANLIKINENDEINKYNTYVEEYNNMSNYILK